MAGNLSKDPEEEGTNKECSRLQTQKPKPSTKASLWEGSSVSSLSQEGLENLCNNTNLTNGLWTLDSEVSLGSLGLLVLIKDVAYVVNSNLNWKLCVLTDDTEKLTLSS